MCAAALLLPLTGCLKVGPDYKSPYSDIPSTWSWSSGSMGSGSRSSDLESWWSAFNDPTLDKLIGTLREENPSVEIAIARIREARAQRGVAQSRLFPQLNGGGAYQRSRASEALILPGAPNPSNFYNAGFDAGWEIDVFGGTRRLVEAADAGIEVQYELYRDTVISLYAEVALNYLEMRTLLKRIKLAQNNADRQAKSLKLTEDRFDAGLVPEIDVTQAESNLRTTEALIPALESQLTFTRNRISALLGGYPGDFNSLLGSSPAIPHASRRFGYGVPADLLRNRPDVRAAERTLAAQTALIGVQVSELYPKFTLAGSLGFDGVDSSEWLTSSSRAWSFGPSFRWRIFSAGEIRNNIRVESEKTDQALKSWEATVLGAVEEVEDSYVAIVKEKQRSVKLDQAVAATEKTVSKISDLYVEGLVDFQNVLDAERTLFVAQDDAAVSEGQIAGNYVRLYKALGGGARPPSEDELVFARTRQRAEEKANRKPLFGKERQQANQAAESTDTEP